MACRFKFDCDGMYWDNLYPFTSALEFFNGFYFLQLEALHLTVGYILLSFMIVRVFSDKRLPLPYKFAIIYFSGTIFNNYAYKFGVTISEVFGIFAVLIFIQQRFIKLNSISNYIILFAIISILHYSFLLLFDDSLVKNFELLRVAVFLKLFVLAFNIIILFNYINSDHDVKKFINYFIATVNIVVICYLVQVFVFSTGTLPYGSFSPAGWVQSIIPSFGSVSIERGHLGKFFVPLFPLFLYAYKVLGYKKSFALYILLAFSNFSASSYAFLFLYLFGMLVFFHKEFKVLISLLVVFVALVLSYFYDEIFGLFVKIYELAIVVQKGHGGGRSFMWIVDIIDNYPLGYGYGGSSYRNSHGISGLDLNNAVVIFFGQLSIIGFPILIIFIFNMYKILKLSRYLNFKFERKLLFLSMIVMSFIFAADVLWFVPVIWLPVVVLTILARNEKRKSIGHLTN